MLLQSNFNLNGRGSGISASSSSIDASGRSRATLPFTLFESQFQYNDAPLVWTTTTASGGTSTHIPASSSVQLATNTTNGSSVIRQTEAYFRYQPGKSQSISMTGVFGTPTTNTTKRLGYYDTNNGVFFQQDSTGLSVVIRSSVSGSPIDSIIPQSSWNLDPMDSTGASKLTLDSTKAQIFVIDFQWLGVGSVRFGVSINGSIIYVHRFDHANLISSVYMTTANLPLRYEIFNTGVSTGGTLIQICSTVISEGGFELTGYPFSVGNAATGIAVSTRRAILTIRPKATFNSIANTALILPQSFSIFSANDPAYYEIVHDGIVSGTSFTSVDANSVVEYDVAGTTVTGGQTVYSGYVPTGGPSGPHRSTNDEGFLLKFPLVDSENLSIVCTGIGGTATMYSSFNWTEIY